MRHRAWASRTKAVLATTVMAAVAVVGLGGSAPATTTTIPPSYLALGDSVVFGYITGDGFAYGNANNFIGYPTYVGQALRLRVYNAACPGEATGGFRSLTSADDNGCRTYRAAAPLHLNYKTSQLGYAQAFLKLHKLQTKLVSIGLGANDAFLLQKQCAGSTTCITNGLPALLTQISTNLTSSIKSIRATGYSGRLLVVNYYSTDYSDPILTFFTAQINAALKSVAAATHVVLVNEFVAFQTAAAHAGGSTCKAALLGVTPGDQTTCDVHPSQSGQQLLAKTVVAAAH